MGCLEVCEQLGEDWHSVMPQLVIQAEEGTFKFRFRDLRDLTFVRRLIVEPARSNRRIPYTFFV